MNYSQPSRTLKTFILSLFIMIAVTACGGANNDLSSNNKGAVISDDNSSPDTDTDDDNEDSDDSKINDNLKYIKSASIVVNELWIRDTDDNKQELLKGNSKTVQLVPSSNDFADMNLELTDLPAGEYNHVRLILESGTVLLADNVYVKERKHSDNHNGKRKDKVRDKFRDRHDDKKPTTNPRLFTTEQGNLKFPSGFQNGIKANIEPPIKIVSNLVTELLVLSFDLNKSFIFNGSATKRPGVKRVLFKPIIKVSNASTHGIVTLEGLSGTTGGVKCASNELLAGAKVTAVDIDEIKPPVSTTTDVKGNAKLVLLQGDYTLTISKDGYEDSSSSINVAVANNTYLNKTTLIKDRNIADPKFDKDIAILLSKMSSEAYSLHTKDDELHSCWTVFEQIDKQSTGTKLFIAYNNSGDIIVSFAGTEASKLETGEHVEALKDLIIDGGIIKSAMIVNNEGKANYYPGSVHSGFAIAYASIKSELQNALNQLIRNVANPVNSRIYFTGHSLGGSLATIAALDWAEALKSQRSYNENHIFMYSFGSSRTLTHNKIGNSLRTDYSIYVPNNFAVIARDDTAPHLLGLYDGSNSYYHLENLIVLNTNIHPGDREVIGTHKKIGLSRIVKSDGLRYKGCSNATSFAGHDIKQYTTRLEGKTIKDDEGNIIRIDGRTVSEGLPAISIHAVDTASEDSWLRNWKIRLSWGAGVQGLCDKIALYKTTKDEAPTNAKSILLDTPFEPNNWQWAVKGSNYPTAASSRYITGSNPTRALATDNRTESGYFWIGYVDGFGRFLEGLKPVKWTKPAKL